MKNLHHINGILKPVSEHYLKLNVKKYVLSLLHIDLLTHLSNGDADGVD